MSTIEQRIEEFDRIGIYEDGRHIGSCPTKRVESFIAEHIQSNFNHWQGIVNRSNDPRSVIADGCSYWIGTEHGPNSTKGFGGQPWTITFFDDRGVVYSTSLWHQGDVPAEWRNQLPDNADLKSRACMTTALEYAHQIADDISAQTGERYIVKDDDGHPLIVSAEPTCYELLEECRTVLRAMISAPTLARNAVPNAERMIERLDAALGGE